MQVIFYSVKNLEYLQLVEAERQLHLETKDKLRETERLAQERILLYHDCTRSYEKSIQELKHEVSEMHAPNSHSPS